jgi:hypothetical protein
VAVGLVDHYWPCFAKTLAHSDLHDRRPWSTAVIMSVRFLVIPIVTGRVWPSDWSTLLVLNTIWFVRTRSIGAFRPFATMVRLVAT